MSISSTLNLENNYWKSCKYQIGVTMKFSDGTTKELQSSQISELFQEKDYDKYHLPILILTVAISNLDDVKVRQDPYMEFIIRINQYYLEKDGTEKKQPRQYLYGTFVTMESDDTPNDISKLEQTVRESQGYEDDDVTMEDLSNSYTYILVYKEDLTMSKKIVNAVLSNVTQMDAVAYMASVCGCKKALISNFTNVTTFNELVLLPMQFLAQLIYLESEYGWHKEGTYLFLDYGKLLILRKNGVCTAYESGETKKVVFCITNAYSTDDAAEGVLQNNGVTYVNIGTGQFEVINGSIIGDQLEGSNMILIDQSTGDSVTIESGVSSYDGGSYTVKTYNGHNTYLEEQYKRQKIEAENTIQLSCLNADISYFTPNKEYGFLTDITDMLDTFKGSYRLSGVKTSFIKNGDYFNTASVVTVKRVEKSV